jgi:hypothetical protein
LLLAQELADVGEWLEDAERVYARAIKRELRRHALSPWRSQLPGLQGVHTARLIARIGNPHRFPGQPCTAGHIVAPVGAVGGPPASGTTRQAASAKVNMARAATRRKLPNMLAASAETGS